MKLKPSVYDQNFSETKFSQDNNTYAYILSQVQPSDHSVLDLGCSSVFIGHEIKKRFPKIKVTGIDNNLADITKAKKVLDEAFLADLDNFQESNISGKFDLIILADIIEHLTHPRKLLVRLKKLLNPDGRILLSIPNFSHYSIINSLLQHNWHYHKSGLLDKTHVHFYNYRTIVKLIEANHFYISKIELNQSLPDKSVQITEMIENYLPLNYSLYQKIYNPENMVFQYLFTFSNQKPKTYRSFLTKKQEILSKYTFPIMNSKQFYFRTLRRKSKILFTKVISIFTTTFSNKNHFLKKQFIEQLGYIPNFDNPRTFDEKIQWLKLYYRNPLLSICADKFAVREFVKQKIGEKYLIPLIGAYDGVNAIKFSKLPNKFILKSNNSSGKNIICLDKSLLDTAETKKKLQEWLMPNSNLYSYSYEWAYRNIKPKIICEKFLDSKKSLIDYKFYCFNGQPKFIQVISERNISLKADYYDLKWKSLPIHSQSPRSIKGIKKPSHLNEMIQISQKLSSNFPYVRVDLYQVNNQVYFGELTFYPNAGMVGFKPSSWDRKIGDMLQLPKSPNIFLKTIYNFL